jgi:toxin YhaV
VPIIVNGWTLFAHPLLFDQIERVATAVRKPNDAPSKVLKWLIEAIFDYIPADPTRNDYRQGRTLGRGKTHWFRDKYAGRFRLFFRYDSGSKIIIYGWVNDENTLRTRGARSDAYAVFKRVLDAGTPPNDWKALLKEASAPKAQMRLAAKEP